jgi:cation diffusion facilitator family transporter
MVFEKRKKAVALLSIFSNSFLVAGKLIVGVLIGSVSVISEAIHSAVDLLAAVIAFLAVRSSSKPADDQHPYGHGKWENISGAVEALLIIVAACWIMYESIHKFYHPADLPQAGLGVVLMLISAAMNLIVSHFLFKVGKQTDSMALLADGWHLRTDVYTSAGVMVGLGVIWLGGLFFEDINLLWLDPLVAMAVAILILYAASKLVRDSLRDLLDESLPMPEQVWISNKVRELQPTVRSCHKLRTRRSGTTRFIDLHLVVAPNMTVEKSHEISHQLAAEIQAHFRDSSVIAHIEPCDGRCPQLCVDSCMLSPAERAAIQGK